MSLLTSDQLKTMDYAFQAQPFVNLSLQVSINLLTMDYVFQGQPFVSVVAAVAAAGNPYYAYAQQQ